MTHKKLTIIMPAKNASKYIEKTLETIARQTYREMIQIHMIYAESRDDTRERFEETCKKHKLTYIIENEEESIYRSTWDIFGKIVTPYFGIMCFSDGYLSDSYLEEAATALDNNKNASYAHSDLHTMLRNGKYTVALPIRCWIRPESGSAFTANICCANDGINELTLVGRTEQAKTLLAIAERKQKLRVNPYGALFTMFLCFGCTGVFIPRISVYGRHHGDSRNANKTLAEHDGQWIETFNKARIDVITKIQLGEYKWRDGQLVEIEYEENIKATNEFKKQMEYISTIIGNMAM